MTRYADDWLAAVDQVRDLLTELNRQVTAQLDQAWRGQGADAALASLRRYVTGSLDGLTACRSLAVHLTELSGAAGDLRARITAPVAGDVASARLEEALGQVRQLYSGPAVAAGNAVADIPEPPDPFPAAGPAATNVLPAGLPTAAQAVTPSTVAPLGSAPSAPNNLSRPSTPAADAQPLWRTPTHSALLNPLVSEALPARADPPASTPTPAPSGMPATVAAESPRAAGRTNP
jgi:hypothetical protein